MYTETVLLTLAALLPALILCGYVFHMDRMEKESLGLLLKLFFAGVGCCFPAIILEETFIEVINLIFLKLRYTGYLPDSVDYLHSFTTQLLGVALVEEGLKWICLNIITKKNREFNFFFDGLLYAVFVSLGFATFENIMYVLEYGWVNAIMRAVFSVPGHMFFAVMMGYYYSRSNIIDLAKKTEADFQEQGMIGTKGSAFSSTKFKWMSLCVPVVVHCTYNFCCSSGSMAANLSFMILIVFLYVHCFGKIRKMSAVDEKNQNYAMRLVLKAYPYLNQEQESSDEVE